MPFIKEKNIKYNMSCLLTSGIAKGCRDNSGGIKKVLLANKSSLWNVTPTAESNLDLGLISNINLADSVGAPTKFFEFVPNKMSSNWVENFQSNVQNGTIGYEQVLTLIFSKNEASKRNQIKLLGQAEIVAIVQDFNNKYFLLGEYNGLEVTGGKSDSGTNLNDLNGWSITIGGMEPNPAREISEGIIAGLTILQATDLATSAIDTDTATLALTEGEGDGVAIFVKEATYTEILPTNGTEYTSSLVFETGDQLITSGWYCVYSGVYSAPLVITALTTATKYYVRAFEYAGTGIDRIYCMSKNGANPISFQTI